MGPDGCCRGFRTPGIRTTRHHHDLRDGRTHRATPQAQCPWCSPTRTKDPTGHIGCWMTQVAILGLGHLAQEGAVSGTGGGMDRVGQRSRAGRTSPLAWNRTPRGWCACPCGACPRLCETSSTSNRRPLGFPRRPPFLGFPDLRSTCPCHERSWLLCSLTRPMAGPRQCRGSCLLLNCALLRLPLRSSYGNDRRRLRIDQASRRRRLGILFGQECRNIRAPLVERRDHTSGRLATHKL